MNSEDEYEYTLKSNVLKLNDDSPFSVMTVGSVPLPIASIDKIVPFSTADTSVGSVLPSSVTVSGLSSYSPKRLLISMSSVLPGEKYLSSTGEFI